MNPNNAAHPTFTLERIDPSSLPPPVGNYTHGVAVSGARRTVHVSGQVPWGRQGEPLPQDFATQCRMVWNNVLTVLNQAGLGLEHLVKVTTYLSDRQYRAENGRIREEVLGGNRPAITIIICDIYAPEWLLEIEAIAVE